MSCSPGVKVFEETLVMRSDYRRTAHPSIWPWLPLLYFALLAAVGCGRGGPDIDAQPVGGVVLFNGEPVEGATVSFTPEQRGGDAEGVPAVGRTGADGVFHLRALQSGRPLAAGTTVGQYVVTVVKQEIPALSDPALVNNPPPTLPPAMLEPRDLLPAIYGSTAQSPLRAEVQKGNNRFRFELSSEQRRPR